jgi:hypothetical protein
VQYFLELLSGGDLRSIAQSDNVVGLVQNQEDFDELFHYLFHAERLVVMRAADAVEKITVNHRGYLASHKNEIIELCKNATDKELKWHLALIVSRLKLRKSELGIIRELLTSWALDEKESRIVRVNSVEGLFNLLQEHKELEQDFELLLLELERQGVPSLNARIRRIKKLGGK